MSRSRGELQESLDRLAVAVDAWLPFAGVPDEEFRKISSSPDGAYGTLRLGYRCNQDCWFCWQDRRAPGPPLERFYVWLDEFAEVGVASVNFTGGEATTWSGLPDLVRRAAKVHGLRTSLQTNAVRLARPEYTRQLVEAGLEAVMVSLHSADPDVSDRMTRAPGTHRRTMEGVEQALQQGLTVTLTCVVEAHNYRGLPSHAQMIVDRFVRPGLAGRLRRVTYAHPTEYHDPALWAAQQVPFDDLRPSLTAAVVVLREAGVPVQVGGPCGFPICAVDVGLVPDPYEVVTRAGFHSDELQHRRYAATCGSCSAREDCFGLRQEYLDRFGERGLRPFTPAKSR